MTTKKKISTRIFATFMAFVVMFLCVENLVAYGAQTTLQCYDRIGEVKDSPLGTHSILKMQLDSTTRDENGNLIYGMCIQPNTTAESTNIYTDSYLNVYYTKVLSDSQREGIGYIMHYGYPEVSVNNAYFCATQLLVWELVSGYRSFNKNNTSIFATTSCSLLDYFVPKNHAEAPTKSAVTSAYNTIVSKVSKHVTVPNNTYTERDDAISNPIALTYNATTKRYEATITVNNTSLWADCQLTNSISALGSQGIRCGSVVNGKLTVWSNNYFKGTKVTVGSEKLSTKNGYFENVAVWSNLSVKPDNEGQAIARGAYSDPVYAYMAFEIAEGDYTFAKLYQTKTGSNIIASSAKNPELNENARFKLFKLKDGTSDYRLKENWLKVDVTGTNGTYTFSSMVASNAGSPMKLSANGKINNFPFMKQNKRYAEEI